MIKKIIFILILVLLISNCKAQEIKKIGIGLLEANTNFDIPLFINHEDTIPAATIHLKQMKNGQVFYESSIELDPQIMYEGESEKEAKELINSGLVTEGPSLRFRVIEVNTKYFKVIVNEENGEEYYIKKNAKAVYYDTKIALEASYTNKPFNGEWFVYETWERYLKRVEYIELETTKIYDKPNGKVIFSEESYEFYPFKVAEVKGEWIKLKKDKLRERNFEKGINYEGWYQWKKGNNWQIHIVEYTIE